MAPLAAILPDGSLAIPATKSHILAEYPELRPYPIEQMLTAVEATLGDVRPFLKKRPQYLWLFYLAGRLKSFFSTDDQASEDIALSLSPFAWVFSDLLKANGLTGGKNRIDWSDAEAVELEWLSVWATRKLAVGSSALNDAFDIAKNNPLQLQGNRYFVLVINMGYALQQQNGEFPFILPVNTRVGQLLGTTMPTVAAAVSRAIRFGYFVIHEGKYSPSTRRARLFYFNYAHPLLPTWILPIVTPDDLAQHIEPILKSGAERYNRSDLTWLTDNFPTLVWKRQATKITVVEGKVPTVSGDAPLTPSKVSYGLTWTFEKERDAMDIEALLRGARVAAEAY